MPAIWLSLGSNRDRERSLRGAVRTLRATLGPLVLSSVYESAAVGFVGEPFLNLVAGGHTEMPPEAVQAWLREIEDAHGRVRGPDRFAPRTLDIDLLTYGDAVLPALRLPRDEILHHAFVLGPLAEVAPDERHPLDGRSYAALWAAFDRAALPLRRVELAWDED
jgi:2-amino-4-hydroxy-6-hydroxymethyldihydropteridine diphosphokinase